ncbi:MAG TPA: hypothetical protein VFH06_04375 [Candidatus Saccharimonadales bacterium]|nr:hypothetical protein [Candidatus Saccharimonadales bacterium]
MTTSVPREPTVLRPHHENGAVTCVTAQILYVFHRQVPSMIEIDRAAAGSGEPNAGLSDADAHFYLLRQGFKSVAISSYDMERGQREGKSYLREYYGADCWGDEHEAYFTPEVLARNDEADRAHLARMEPFLITGAARDVKKVATKQDVTELLSSGHVIDATLDENWPANRKKRVQPAVLLVPDMQSNGSMAWVFVPSRDGHECIWHFPLAEALDYVRYDRTVTGITL